MDKYSSFELNNSHSIYSNMNALHVDSVIKSYGNKQILTDIYISCVPGEIVGLLGRNGTGKSTLLKIIFGSLNANRKFVRIDHKLVKGLFNSRKMISYLPQHNFLPSHVTVKSAIELFCDKRHANLIKKHALISPLVHKKSKHLSGGERRLLEIFLIIFSNSKYVLIDEPFNGVAPIYKEEIKNIIKEQSKTKGFIITDHDYRNILDVATRTVIIHDGGTKIINDREELKKWGYISEKDEN